MSNETVPRNEETMIQVELETLRTPTSRTVYLGKGRYRIEVEACAEERSGSTSSSTVKCFCSSNPNTTYTETGNFAVGSGIGGRGTQKALLVFSGLPTLSPSCYITSASLTVKPAVNGSGTMAMNAYEVTAYTEYLNAPTWNHQPTCSTMPFDYRIPSQYYGDPCTYDITNQVRRWYDGKNWGIVLEGVGRENRTFFVVQHTSKPVVTIDYISSAGLESWFALDTHGVGRSGSASVNLFNGNLVLSHQETVMNGRKMLVSVSRYYNSCESGSNDLGVGYGWRYSVQQSKGPFAVIGE